MMFDMLHLSGMNTVRTGQKRTVYDGGDGVGVAGRKHRNDTIHSANAKGALVMTENVVSQK